MPPAEASPLAAPLTRLWGVGPERAAQLARLGLRTIGDLLLLRPRRHEDRRHWLPLRELKVGVAAAARGRIVTQGVKTYRKATRSIFEFVLEDGTARLHCRWWNCAFMEKYFAVGDEVMVYGRPLSLRPLTMDHPETEVVEGGEEVSIHLDRVAPVYPLTEGLPQRWLRSLVWRTLAAFERHITEPWPDLASLITTGNLGSKGPVSAPEASGPNSPAPPNSDALRAATDFSVGALPSRVQAVRWLHFPEDPNQPEVARQRLALDELIELQLQIQTRRRHLQANARGLPCAGDNRFLKPFLAHLGFTLTDAQTAVLREIRRDMQGRYPMRRLLQGDVGSGKTVVAACTALMAMESGFNVALMAPTEILAEQHFRNFTTWFRPLGLGVALRTGQAVTNGESQNPKSESRNSKFEFASDFGFRASNLGLGEAGSRATLVIGTHALIEPGFTLPNLGLVIIDEQHKFGVAQRETLLRKGRYPHLLVMTATPIPRTLGLTLYGDLDLSVLRQLPPGRGRVRTFVRGPAQLPKVYEFIRRKLAEGRQAYVVYPRIEDTDLKTGLKAVKQEYEKLATELAPHRVDLLHGRVRPEEKDAVMAAFRAGQVKVLLATSVVEVGMDVPNATVMLIENAAQFGLAQLHQMRGRIGRGAHESYCVLVVNRVTPEARQRLRVMEQTHDGFRLAEADLELRGPGEFLGRDQSGLPPFKFADLAKDRGLLEWARVLAGRLPDPPKSPRL